MTAKEWLFKTYNSRDRFCVRPRALCKDGFSISIQANPFVYCTPRKSLLAGNYIAVELGFASRYEELLEEYQEGTIYPYVPMEVVEKVIEKHGGIVGEGARWKD